MMKMSKIEMYAQIMNHLTDPEEVAFLEKERNILIKRNEDRKLKMTKTQEANAILREAIFAAMDPERCYTIAELVKEVEELAEASSQKVTALLKQLKAEGKIEQTYEKRIAHYKVLKVA